MSNRRARECTEGEGVRMVVMFGDVRERRKRACAGDGVVEA